MEWYNFLVDGRVMLKLTANRRWMIKLLPLLPLLILAWTLVLLGVLHAPVGIWQEVFRVDCQAGSKDKLCGLDRLSKGRAPGSDDTWCTYNRGVERSRQRQAGIVVCFPNMPQVKPCYLPHKLVGIKPDLKVSKIPTVDRVS